MRRVFSARNSFKIQKKETRKYSVFNNKYEIIQELGEGKSSRVFLGRDISKPDNLIAIKLIKQDYIK